MCKRFCWLPLIAIAADIGPGATLRTAQPRGLVLDNVRVVDGSGDAPGDGRSLDRAVCRTRRGALARARTARGQRTSPLEAITAATGTAAAFLYRSDQLGTLRRDLQADLVVLHDNPLRDISAIRTVERVMVGGQWVDVGHYRAVLRHRPQAVAGPAEAGHYAWTLAGEIIVGSR